MTYPDLRSTADGPAAAAGPGASPRMPAHGNPRPPLALLRGAAAVLPRPALERLANAVIRRVGRSHPTLLANLARIGPAVVHIAPTDLPYRFVVRFDRESVALATTDRDAPRADAEVSASVATLVDLLEGRIDGDTSFFRRDLAIRGDTSVIVALRNTLDREPLCLAHEIAATFGPLRVPGRALAKLCDRVLERVGARIAAMHGSLHPRSESGPDVPRELERVAGEIAALTARLAMLEARQRRRADKGA